MNHNYPYFPEDPSCTSYSNNSYPTNQIDYNTIPSEAEQLINYYCHSDKRIFDPDSLFDSSTNITNITNTLTPTATTTPNNYNMDTNNTTMVYSPIHTTQAVVTATPSPASRVNGGVGGVVTADISHLPPSVQHILTQARLLTNFTEEKILTDNDVKGWILHIHERKKARGGKHFDRYWYTPKTGKKMRSNPEVSRFLGHLKSTHGDEDKAWELFKGRTVKQGGGIKRSTNALEDGHTEPVKRAKKQGDPNKNSTQTKSSSLPKQSQSSTPSNVVEKGTSSDVKKVKTRTKKAPKAKSSQTTNNNNQNVLKDDDNKGYTLVKKIAESKLRHREPISMDIYDVVELAVQAEAKNPAHVHQKITTSKEQKSRPLSFTLDPELPSVAESK